MDKKTPIPKWLEQTQQNSWEPEIFISGIVLFGLIQVPQYLNDFRFFFKREIFGTTTDIDNLVAFIATGIQWLIFGLVLHLFFRGVWIGLVGLSYVFPKGINNDKLKFYGKFSNRISTIPHFSSQIIQLEKVSSSIFSISYFLFMSLLGSYSFIFIAIVIPIYIVVFFSGLGSEIINNPAYVQYLNLYALGMLAIGLIYLIDFLTLGWLKKIKFINKIYFPIYKIMSILTFSKLYRNVYYILISNFKRWKVILFICVFIVITINLIGLNATITPTSRSFSQLEFYASDLSNYMSSGSYANMPEDPRYQRATIQSDIIKDNVLRLFITQRILYQDSIKALCNYDLVPEKTDSLKLACLKQFYIININDSTYHPEQWFFHMDPRTRHRGIMTYIDISHLNKGMHQLKIDLKNWRFKNYSHIPFYKE